MPQSVLFYSRAANVRYFLNDYTTIFVAVQRRIKAGKGKRESENTFFCLFVWCIRVYDYILIIANKLLPLFWFLRYFHWSIDFHNVCLRLYLPDDYTGCRVTVETKVPLGKSSSNCLLREISKVDSVCQRASIWSPSVTLWPRHATKSTSPLHSSNLRGRTSTENDCKAASNSATHCSASRWAMRGDTLLKPARLRSVQTPRFSITRKRIKQNNSLSLFESCFWPPNFKHNCPTNYWKEPWTLQLSHPQRTDTFVIRIGYWRQKDCRMCCARAASMTWLGAMKWFLLWNNWQLPESLRVTPTNWSQVPWEQNSYEDAVLKRLDAINRYGSFSLHRIALNDLLQK